MSSRSPVPRTGGSGSVACSCTTCLDAAVEYLAIKQHFIASFDYCVKGLESLTRDAEQDECSMRHSEMKAAFVIVGIQALAEMNEWRRALSWVLEQYCEAEKIPAKIIQMCILLYVKVNERAVMKDVVCDWLHCSSNMNQSGFGTVAELYYIHILVPLGHTTEALEFLESDIASAIFTDEQKDVALSLLNRHNEKTELLPNQNPEAVAVVTSSDSNNDKMLQRVKSILRLLHRALSAASVRVTSISLQKGFLALILLYLLLVRTDPALPAGFQWLLHLHRLLQQMWATIFGPHYRIHGQS